MDERALVRTLRAELGEDTATFGERFARSPRSVENWEQGRRVPDPFVVATLRKLWNRRRKNGKKA